MKKALYINHTIPSDDALTRRSLAIVNLLEKCGYDVAVVCAGITSAGCSVPDSFFGRKIFCSNDLFLGKFQLVQKYSERLCSSRAKKLCEFAFDEVEPSLVVTYELSYELASFVHEKCRQINALYLVDNADWFDVRFSGDVAVYIIRSSRDKRFRLLDCQADGVIAISEYLQTCFFSKGVPSFFLPSVVAEMPSADVVRQKRHSSCELRLIYAGCLDKGKDFLYPVLEYISRQANNGARHVSIDIAGVSVSEFESRGWSSYLGDERIRVHGVVPHSAVIDLLKTADFGVLFREDKRYAKAGFSTKFSECMSMGVPMICNKVGGADSVLTDGVDGIVLQKADLDTVFNALDCLVGMELNDIEKMSHNARTTAEKLFMLERYVSGFNDFLELLREGYRSMDQYRQFSSRPSGDLNDGTLR